MAASLTDRRDFDDRWVLERKLDGVRCIGRVVGGGAHLVSRNQLSFDATFPELRSALADAASADLIVDGEIVAMDGDRTSFAMLQPRLGTTGGPGGTGPPTPVQYHLFDLIWFDGHDLRSLDLLSRQATLLEVVSFGGLLHPPTHVVGPGVVDMDPICAAGWEGLIAKRASSTYQERRSRDWLKLKCASEQELVVVGFTSPNGQRTGFGALLLAVHDGGELRYAGKVGTGFDQATLRTLRAALDELVVDAPTVAGDLREREVQWVRPELVVQVAFDAWTRDGRLRHPRFTGVRPDKRPEEVVRERPGSA